MSSLNKKSNLENVSSLDGHENNDCDNNSSNVTNLKKQQETLPKRKNNRKYLNKMLHLLKEFIIMVLVAIAYATITNDPPKIGKSPAAYRFFQEDSHITDWYRGEISDAINQARGSDIAFVMFYAPWDAECQHTRKEFQIAAQHLHEQVSFSAVNCWQPGSECRTQYSKVHKWPILIAYPTHGRGVQYNGPLVAVYMIQFLKKLIYPFTRNVQFFNLLAQHDAIVMAEINAEPFSKEFGTFYQTTLRLLERDPFQEIAISVKTQPFYDKNGEINAPQLSLFLWNETLFYPSTDPWETEKLLSWILKNVHQVATWISPSGSKSLSLANYLQPGPALILFTPKNPLATHNDFYSMLREVALEYENCNQTNVWIKLVQLAIGLDRKEKYLEHLRLIEKCSMKKFKIKKVISPNLWSNTSYCFEKKNQNENLLKSESSMVHYYGGLSQLCVEILKNFDKTEVVSKTKCSDVNKEYFYKSSKFSDESNYKSPKYIENYFDEEKCRTLLLAQKYQPIVFSSELYNMESYNISGLKCQANKTLTFISMDSLNYHHYAEKLGIDLSKKPNKTAVVILDNKMESHYVMEDSVNESNIKMFIHNYTKGLLNRSFNSLTTVISKNTHSYSNKQQCFFDDAKFCMKELTSSNFLETIYQNNKAVIIFYYSKQCSFCNGISYRFLTVAKYFASLENFQFSRIDGDLNLLPWEYTMDIYPTILFVPPNRVSESRIFPIDIPITVPNLIWFILENLQPSLKLETMSILCERAELYSNATECYTSLRLQILNIIDKILQEWRLSSSLKEKQISLLKLKHCHELYTSFLEYPQNITVTQYHFNRLKYIENIQN